MQHDITYYAKKRHTTKAYDPNRRIPDETVEKLKELLRFSPSSTNIQPWHFVIASTQAGKERVAKATVKYSFNRPSILNASHVVVFASRLAVEEGYLQHVLEQEDKDGRFDTDKEKGITSRIIDSESIRQPSRISASRSSSITIIGAMPDSAIQLAACCGRPMRDMKIFMSSAPSRIR